MNGEMSKKLTVPSKLTSPNLTVLIVPGKYSGSAATGGKKGIGEEPSMLTTLMDAVVGSASNPRDVNSTGCTPKLKASCVPSGDQLSPSGSRPGVNERIERSPAGLVILKSNSDGSAAKPIRVERKYASATPLGENEGYISCSKKPPETLPEGDVKFPRNCPDELK